MDHFCGTKSEQTLYGSAHRAARDALARLEKALPQRLHVHWPCPEALSCAVVENLRCSHLGGCQPRLAPHRVKERRIFITIIINNNRRLSQACPLFCCVTFSDGPQLAARHRSCSAAKAATTALVVATRAAVDCCGPGHVYAPQRTAPEDGQSRERGTS